MVESKFSNIREANKDVVVIEKEGTSNLVKQATLQKQVDRIDAETNKKVERVKAEPTNKELELRQAKENLALAKKENKRTTKDSILDAEDTLIESKRNQEYAITMKAKVVGDVLKQTQRIKEDAETQAERLIGRYCWITKQAEKQIKDAEVELKQSQRNLEYLKETATEREESANTKATQIYEKIVAEIDNADKNLANKIDKIKDEGEQKKSELLAQLDKVNAEIKAHERIVSRVEKCYNDIKEMTSAGTKLFDIFFPFQIIILMVLGYVCNFEFNSVMLLCILIMLAKIEINMREK